jgi:hypothetical protein
VVYIPTLSVCKLSTKPRKNFCFSSAHQSNMAAETRKFVWNFT